MAMSLPRAHPAIVFALLCFAAAPALAQTPAAMPSPTASPSPTPTPIPNVTWQTNVSGYSFKTNNPNATGALDTRNGIDLTSRTNLSNLMTTVTRNTGLVRFGATVGEYAFPVVGQALNPTFKAGSNTDLFGIIPVAYVQYVPTSSLTISAGKLATMIGQENGFTWQDVTIQRGLAWNSESTISRGVRVTYVRGPFSGNLEYNDGYYSGRLNSLEGLFGWQPTANTNLQFAFLVPPSNQGPNPTTSIANKRLYDLMLTQTFGKLTLTPYLLWVDSPQDATIGFNGDERAFFGVMIANYTFSPTWSVGARYESGADRSTTTDTSANADFLGYGPGSSASTITLTPTYKAGHFVIRGEYSSVNLLQFTPGLGFGSAGTTSAQSRLGIEIGAQF
jgi:hypothetical protein